MKAAWLGGLHNSRNFWQITQQMKNYDFGDHGDCDKGGEDDDDSADSADYDCAEVSDDGDGANGGDGDQYNDSGNVVANWRNLCHHVVMPPIVISVIASYFLFPPTELLIGFSYCDSRQLT